MNGAISARGSIAGVVSAVPSLVITNADCPDPAAADEAAKMTGVFKRRWVRTGQTAMTLCTEAAVHLLDRLDWPSDTVDLLVYVTQTPEHAIPADAYRIAAELRLPARCMVLQANWSCSGYVYGLLTALRLLDPGKRALLLVGDAISKLTDAGDRATSPLFGDAGSATAIVGGGELEQRFVVGSDGSGADQLACALHGSITIDDDIEGPFLHMDGAEVFSFTLRQVPQLVADVLAFGRPDWVLFHQANLFMLRHLVKKAKLLELVNPAQIPTNIAEFGNCSCASIPLLMCSELASPQALPGSRVAMFGYGAGWAWAGASVQCDRAMLVELLEV